MLGKDFWAKKTVKPCAATWPWVGWQVGRGARGGEQKANLPDALGGSGFIEGQQTQERNFSCYF